MRWSFIIVAVAELVLLAACGPAVEIDGQLYDPRARLSERSSNTSTTTTRPKPVTCVGADLGSIATQILTPKCATSGCHTGAAPAQGLGFDVDLATLAARLRQPASESASGMPLITPNGIGASYLYLKVALDSPLSGGPMPPSEKLKDCEIAAIKAWVEAGAN